ncbi:hypothetical protein K3495_g9852 [Podosphaera aphanis]|nr:hypothetical protein K3495_g9852 [Podosphaera aphanis]
MDQTNILSLLKNLQSNDDPTRKLAVFNLQASINDPALADIFITSGGLQILGRLIIITSGNTLAYALTALSRLLEVEMGWEIFESDESRALIKRMVELVVTNPLVNILRGAMSILVAVVSHSQNSIDPNQHRGFFGFCALEPAISLHPRFFEMVVAQLSSADNLLCTNSLMLLNALMRDAIINDKSTAEGSGELSQMSENWSRFNKKLQDLGIVQIVYDLMQHPSLQDLAYPLFEFQMISKMQFKIWRNIVVNFKNPEHQKALESVNYTIGNTLAECEPHTSESATERPLGNDKRIQNQQNLAKWQSLGFQTEDASLECKLAGYLGLMDLQNFVTNEDKSFQEFLLSAQSDSPIEKKFPFARASLTVTEILYEHFEIDSSDLNNPKSSIVFDGRKNCENFLRPLVLQWPRLHISALSSFFYLWEQTSAEQEDFQRIADLLRVLVDDVIGGAPRTKNIEQVEEELRKCDHHRLRELQIEALDMDFEDIWDEHLSQVRNELSSEAFQFVKEQRIRALLQGAWFLLSEVQKTSLDNLDSETPTLKWRYVKLSHNRRYLHLGDFHSQTIKDPPLETLVDKIDLASISSVVSDDESATNDENLETFRPATSTTAKSSEINVLRDASTAKVTRITINGNFPTSDNQSQKSMNSDPEATELPILTLVPANQDLAPAWLDGLLMLLNQSPITTETNKMLDLIVNYGLKIKMLNVRLDSEFMGPPEGAGVVPSRIGLDEDYFYEI